MRMLLLAFVAVLAPSFVAVMPVEAETTIAFSGRVDQVPSELMPELQPEMPLSGFYTFDETLSEGNFLATVTDFQMLIGDYVVRQASTPVNGDIKVTPNDYIAVSFANGATIGDEYAPLLMALQLSSTSPVADPSSPIPPAIEAFDDPLWTLDFSSTTLPLRVEGTVQTLVVPEPSSCLLFAMGFILMGRNAARCRQKPLGAPSRKPKRR